MKSVLIFIFLVLFISRNGVVRADVQCGENRFCPVGFRPYTSVNTPNEWQLRRNAALQIASFNKHNIVGILSSNLESLKLDGSLDELCLDDTIGFLLDKNVSNYRISCIWTGVSQFGQCRAVPEMYMNRPFSFIGENEWMGKLMTVRSALGCNTFDRVYEMTRRTSKIEENSNSTTTKTTKKVMMRRNYSNPRRNPSYILESTELFICNERCVQGGIGYLATLVIILSLAISFFKNCVELE
ncbi:unnamed protein product [Caenorhabditis nigoni]|uniref:Receptor L-domain domain-containing protein n=1 Tax=Caenorhabditis nigoni TaxID=1611254 RepID=A0A2G5UZK1_9PELO|nr:hypothetical protein B9Z55_005057 [Caenorhabditis nigoni]